MEPEFKVWIMQATVWLSYLYFPASAALGYLALTRSGLLRIFSVLALIPLTLLAYARFIEPRLLVTQEHEIQLCSTGLPGTMRVGVAADFHLGIFPNAMPLERVVRSLNSLDLDVVLIPGDFTLYLHPKKAPRTFAPLSALTAPAYAVMGNHDVGLPGLDLSDGVVKALEGAGVTVLNPGTEVFRSGGKYLRIVGTRDYWDADFRQKEVGGYEERLTMATILLQHNPDLIKDPRSGAFDLMVSGHTHGGQINLPLLTCGLTFACDTLRYGYSDTALGKLFVTSGTGMTGLPLRFGVAPKVDVLNLTLDRCRDSLPTVRRASHAPS